jgi:hypothetical protein
MLSDVKGTFVPERVITSESDRECPDWKPINTMQRDVRTTLMGIQGENALRILHRVGTLIQDEEGPKEMAEDMPDFAGMLQEGMMSADREEQLRYETDDDGNVILEDLGKGESIKRPRPTYQLRKFACDPEGYIQLDHSEGMFETQDWLVKHILKIEIEQGFITKSKRTKTTAPTRAKPEETEDMPAGRKVLTRRGNKGGVSKGPKGPKAGGSKSGRVAKPPKKPGATRDAGDEAPTSLPDASSFDIEGLSEDLQVKIGETVSRLVNEKFNELSAQLEDVQARCQELMDGLTIFHDFMIQTGGTMHYEDDGEQTPLPEMYDNDRRILGHLEEEGDPS